MKRIPGLLLLPLLLLAAACNFSSKETVQGDYVLRDSVVYYKGSRPNAVTVHISSDPPSLNPLNGTNGKQLLIRPYLWQKLMDIDLATGKPVPVLAAAQPQVSADGLHYTYAIHESATWDDGKPITAADVVFSAKMALCPLVNNPEAKSYLSAIQAVQTDEGNIRNVLFTFTERYIQNDYVATGLAIIDQRVFDPEGILASYGLADWASKTAKQLSSDKKLAAWAERFNGPDFSTNLANLKGGSGPYSLKEWLPSQQVVLERKPNYWGKALAHPFHHSKPAQLIFRVIPDDKTVEALIKQQQIDVSTSLGTDTYLSLNESETAQTHYHIGTQTRDGLAWVLFNVRPEATHNAPCLADLNVRKAIALAIPVPQMIEGIYQGLATRTSQPLSPMHPDYNKSLAPVPYDLAKAAKLLDDAGWKMGADGIRQKAVNGKNTRLSFTLTAPLGKAVMEQISKTIVAELHKVGIECLYEPIEFGKMSQKISKHAFDAALVSSTFPPTPADFKQLWYSTNWTTGSNYTGFGDAETDKLIDQARTELDPAKRRILNDAILKNIYDAQPSVFLFNLPMKYAIHKRFNNARAYFAPDHVYLGELEMIKYEK